jgi:hypothetical protein
MIDLIVIGFCRGEADCGVLCSPNPAENVLAPQDPAAPPSEAKEPRKEPALPRNACDVPLDGLRTAYPLHRGYRSYMRACKASSVKIGVPISLMS